MSLYWNHPENDVLGSEQVGILGVWKKIRFGVILSIHVS